MKKSPLIVALLAAFSAGCTTLTPDEKFKDTTEALSTARARETTPLTIAKEARAVQERRAYVPLTPRTTSSGAFLKSVQVSVSAFNAVPLSEVLRSLSAQGINIVSDMPLDKYSYTGYALRNVDADTALRSILATSGLDFTADSVRKTVTIRPMSSKTWYLNLGNRRSTYASGSAASANGTAGAPSGNFGNAGAQSGGAAISASPNTMTSGASSVASQDDFWQSLKAELDTRLRVLVQDTKVSASSTSTAPSPTMALPPLPLPGQVIGGLPPSMAQQQPSQQSFQSSSAEASTGTYSSRQVGTYALNPETGAVTVQAPSWILNDLDTYFKRIQEMYNTDITFSGELIVLNTEDVSSEGLDISAFARTARDRYGMVVQNNALGGVTLSDAVAGNRIRQATAALQSVSGPLLGVVSPLDGLQLFSAYLSNLGRVNVIQKPVLSTTSGVPSDFRRTVTRYYNTVSQETAAGGSGSASVGTVNNLVPIELGTVLRVNPRIDISTGLIRAQIELVQTSQSGEQKVQQSLTAGSTVQQVTSPMPIITKIIYSGEALLKDGDLAVMGGQTESAASDSKEGVTGLMNAPVVAGAFGKTTLSKQGSVFYFALKVTVNKRQ
jgi:type II secretory pathway component GspD/PulD (secretin)